MKIVKADRYSKVLYYAVQNDNAKMVRFLLKAEASVQVFDGSGNSLLHISARNGNCYIVNSLLQQGCEVDWQNKVGDTALHCAVLANRKRIVEILLKKGANPSLRNHKDEDSLDCAVGTNNYSLAKVLLIYNSYLEDARILGRSALHTAIARGQEKIVRLLVTHQKQFLDINSDKKLLNLAVRSNNQKIISTLIDAGADVNIRDSKGLTTLQQATSLKNVQLIRMLVEKGADIERRNENGLTALHHAVLTGDERVLALILNSDTNVNAKILDGNTVLHIAAMGSKSKFNGRIFVHLFERGGNLNEPNDSGKTPFHVALENGDARLVKLFMDHGAEVAAKDYYGRSALYFAAKNDSGEALELVLQSKRFRIDEPADGDGATALHVAAKFAKVECIRALIRRGASVNATDSNGDTPIFHIAQWPIRNNIHRNLVQDYVDSGKMLLRNGADVNYETALGENVLELSVEERNTIMVDLIVEHMAIMEEKGLAISETNRKLLNRDLLIKSHYDFCRRELMNMKERKVYGNISLFGILEAHRDIIAGYARNGNLVRRFKDNNSLEDFPVYHELLLEKFSEGVQRQRILKAAVEALQNILQLPPRFHIIYEMTLEYISDEDLRNLTGIPVISRPSNF